MQCRFNFYSCNRCCQCKKFQTCLLFDLLPDVLLGLVFSYVESPRDKVQLMLACKRMEECMKHQDAWAHEIGLAIELSETTSWFCLMFTMTLANNLVTFAQIAYFYLILQKVLW